jgi:hypothetical protein
MKFKDETFLSVIFDEFCAANNLERPGELGGRRYYATCDDVEVKEPDGMLSGAMGNGKTKEEAVASYDGRLAGATIVRYARESYRKELQCPNVWRE